MKESPIQSQPDSENSVPAYEASLVITLLIGNMTIIGVVKPAYGHAISNISRNFISPLFANSRLKPEICFRFRRSFDTSIASPLVAE